MGAPEPCENVTEGESSMTLERGLPCCERGRMDNRLIQEPLDDTESRETSDMGGGAQSPACRMNECRLAEALGGVDWAATARGTRAVLVDVELRGWRGSWGDGYVLSSSTTAELVPGLDEDGGGFGPRLSYSDVSFRLWDGGRWEDDSEGWPKRRPAVAAATTVPVPTSYKDLARVSRYPRRTLCEERESEGDCNGRDGHQLE